MRAYSHPAHPRPMLRYQRAAWVLRQVRRWKGCLNNPRAGPINVSLIETRRKRNDLGVKLDRCTLAGLATQVVSVKRLVLIP
jgi:hypothetical protein